MLRKMLAVVVLLAVTTPAFGSEGAERLNQVEDTFNAVNRYLHGEGSPAEPQELPAAEPAPGSVEPAIPAAELEEGLSE